MATKAKKVKKTVGEIALSKSAQKRLNEQSRSPVPTKQIEVLNFFDALREVTLGKTITRISWESNETYLHMAGEFLMIHIGDKDHQLIVSRGDIEGIDWFVLPTKRKESN
jgi:hypothetical protein